MKEASQGYKKACEVASFLASDKELSKKAQTLLESANQEDKTFFACGGELRLMF